MIVDEKTRAVCYIAPGAHPRARVQRAFIFTGLFLRARARTHTRRFCESTKRTASFESVAYNELGLN